MNIYRFERSRLSIPYKRDRVAHRRHRSTFSDRHSCKPLWKPPFISQYINEDRCHLNGLAIVEGEAKYVTAVRMYAEGVRESI